MQQQQSASAPLRFLRPISDERKASETIWDSYGRAAQRRPVPAAVDRRQNTAKRTFTAGAKEGSIRNLDNTAGTKTDPFNFGSLDR